MTTDTVTTPVQLVHTTNETTDQREGQTRLTSMLAHLAHTTGRHDLTAITPAVGTLDATAFRGSYAPTWVGAVRAEFQGPEGTRYAVDAHAPLTSEGDRSASIFKLRTYLVLGECCGNPVEVRVQHLADHDQALSILAQVAAGEPFPAAIHTCGFFRRAVRRFAR